MKKQVILGALLATTLLQTSVVQADDSAERVIGAIIGGVVGNQVGGGSGKAAATIIGAIAGAVAADNMDDQRRYHHGDRREERRDGPWGRGPGRPDRYPGRPYRPGPPPPPPRYPDRDGQATVVIDNVSRRTGGTWYRLTLLQPMSVSNIEVEVLRANVQLHETVLVTDRNERVQVYEMSRTPLLAQGQRLGTYINRNDHVLAIDIRAESFGAISDILVNVGSQEGYPRLRLTEF